MRVLTYQPTSAAPVRARVCPPIAARLGGLSLGSLPCLVLGPERRLGLIERRRMAVALPASQLEAVAPNRTNQSGLPAMRCRFQVTAFKNVNYRSHLNLNPQCACASLITCRV